MLKHFSGLDSNSASTYDVVSVSRHKHTTTLAAICICSLAEC